MTTTYPGIQFFTKGWSGTLTATDGSSTVNKTPSAQANPIQTFHEFAVECSTAFSGVVWMTITDQGFLKLNTSGAPSLNITFSGTTGAKLGFTTTTHTGVSSITAEGVAPGGFYPYTDNFGILYALSFPTTLMDGKTSFDSGMYFNTPGTNAKTPILRFSCLRAQALEFIETCEHMSNPAKILVWGGTFSNSATLMVGNIRTRESTSLDGWCEFRLEVAVAS